MQVVPEHERQSVGEEVMARKGDKKGAQLKGHTWVFSHYSYVPQGNRIVKVKVERCTTPRHHHATQKTPVSWQPR